MKTLNSIPNRTYKATIFAMLFEDKEHLLELYNAVSGKHYTNPEMLEINTLENAIYMAIRNDISFLIDARLSLYEHQSTYSPNLPLRFLLYISALYSSMTKDANLYGTKAIELPPPRFVIFYNGKDEQPDRQILKLSDLYTINEECSLELEAVMLNVNSGHNKELMEMSHTLWEYAEYTARVREYTETMELEEAVERAIEECIQEGILKEFLEKNRAEAKNMSIFEYDQERHIKQEREEAWEEGRKAGKRDMLWKLAEKKLRKGKTITEIAEELEESEETIKEILDSRKE
ncbi:hypothetical protein [Blautia sp. Marseille-P3201T]|uniref:hypothetical protein n=1 Tax=Blautia sp. Marseille-P3201T TaxID=1907659 RepID=UPI000931CF71|nr:hypothetical protein [Blautia sp. Marseille-P3201T]